MFRNLLEPVDLASLATRNARISEQVSLTQLPRLVEALPTTVNAAPVDCRLSVSFDQADQVTVHGELTTKWQLSCQRCLGDMEYAVDLPFRWIFRRDDTTGFLLSDEPLTLADYIEDELLLELPQIPTHDNESECAAIVSQYIGEPDERAVRDMRQPFAGLKNLLSGEDS